MIVPLERPGRIPDEVLRVPGRDCLLRGGVFGGHLDWVLESHGLPGLEAVWAEMPEGARTATSGRFEPQGWYPFEWLILMDRLIVKLFGGAEGTLLELGRHSAQRNFAGTLDLRKGLSVQNHFWDARSHHDIFQNYGRCEYVPLGDSSFRMNYYDYIVRSRTFCETGLGYFEASVEFLGGGDAIVEEVACQCFGDPTCSYVITWDDSR